MKYAEPAKLYTKHLQYLSFEEFVDKYGLKNEATSDIKIQEIPNEIIIPCGLYLRDDKFTTPSGLVNLHPTKGTHWVMFVNEFYFDSYGCPPPLDIMSFINNGFNSEYQDQKKNIVIVQLIVCMCCISQI